jgi:PAS domain S-box-containing protein
MESLLPVATISLLICGIASLIFFAVRHKKQTTNANLDPSSFDTLPVGVLLTDARVEGNPIVYSNNAFTMLTGYSRKEAQGRNCRFLQGDDNQQAGVLTLQKALKEHRATTVTLRNYRKDGSLFWNEITISPVFDQAGETKLYLGIQQDVTHRQNTAADLMKQNQRLAMSQNMLLELVRYTSTTLDATLQKYLSVAAVQLGIARVGIWQLDEQKQSLDCTLMIRHSEPITESFSMIVEDHPLYFSALESNQLIAISDLSDELSRMDLDFDYSIKRNIGATMQVPININGEFTGVLSLEHTGSSRNWSREDREFSRYIADLCAVAFITEENQAARHRLDEIETLLSEARKVGQLGSFIWYFEDDQLVFSNDILEVLDMRQARPKSIIEMHDRIRPDKRQAFLDDAKRAAATHHEIWQEIYPFTAEGGESRYCEFVAQSSQLDDKPAMRGTIQDVTARIRAERENKRLQQRLRQAEKLETIGTLAGGIAHDFNNLLTPLIGYAELLSADFAEGDRRLTYTGQIIQSGLRAKHLIEQLLTFSLHQQTDKPVVDIQSVMEDVLQSIRPKVNATIKLEAELGDDARLLRANSGQIRQILMNLCLNADNAMRGEGVIRVNLFQTTSAAFLQPKDNDSQPYIAIQVEDSGPGIDETYIKHIFEPFFTTRGIGESTGLGLSVVHGIVKQHGGEIEVSSVPGCTTITIYLPFIASADQVQIEKP